jgi:hypothetical protein
MPSQYLYTDNWHLAIDNIMTTASEKPTTVCSILPRLGSIVIYLKLSLPLMLILVSFLTRTMSSNSLSWRLPRTVTPMATGKGFVNPRIVG